MRRPSAFIRGSWASGGRLAAVAALIAVLLGGPGRANAQCNIPTSAATAVSVSPATEDAIRACAEAARAAFGGSDYAQIKRVRDALLAPLRQSRVSAQFRFTLDEALTPVLREAARSANSDAALNALRIAGELAAVGSIDVLATGLKDERPAVRFMAASGLERSFQHIGSDAPTAVLPLNVVPAVRALAERVAAETDAHAAEGVVIALDAGSKITTANFDPVSVACIEALAGNLGDRLSKGVGGDFNPSVLRASDALGNVMTRLGGAGLRLDEKTRLMIARFSGDALAHAACRVQKASAELSDEERRQLADIVGRAENIFLLAGTQMGVDNRSQNLQQTLQQGGRDTVFLAGVLDTTGKLSKAPFGLDAARFKGACK